MAITNDLYKLYPKHLAMREAIRAIEKALIRLPLELKLAGISVGNEGEWMKERVSAFKESDAGKDDGLFIGYQSPYPATWFNKSRYLDDQEEWYGKNRRLDTTTPQPVDLTEKADPDCEKCYGSGYDARDRKVCACTERALAKGAN
jgi:hypothetical protein